jgi:pimeloyl-ACP methyl ester carboxylesterase
MTSWLEEDVHVNGVRLHYFRTGGDKPPLVLNHGWTNSGLCWAATMRALDADFDVIAYDAQGHGRSDRLGERFGEAERVGALLGLVEQLGLHRPVLMGHSMGAQTVAVASARRPDLARAVILEDPPWYEAADARDRVRSTWTEWFAWVRSLPGKPRSVALAEYRLQQPGWSDETLNLRIDAYQQMDLRLLDLPTRDFTPWRQLAAAFRCPWLLIIGEAGEGRDGIVTVPQAEAALRLSPHLRYVQIKDTGHSPRNDHFEEYIGVVKEFLGSVVNREA